MYILGVDGGGTKVHAVIGNESGQILAEGFGGPGNYQTCGEVQCSVSIEKAISSCLEQLAISKSDLSYGVFGLSGYDEPLDYAVLDRLVDLIMDSIPHKVMHDSWIGLRSVSEDNFGVISICGTGGATTGRNVKGDSIALRNLGYITGNRGGGHEIVKEAIHYAYRSEEGTYIKTALETVIPSCFGVKNLDEVTDILRLEEDWPTEDISVKIPPEVFRLAHEGDEVCKALLNEMGTTLGQYASGVIKRLGMEKEKVPCVLVGSLFRQNHPMLNDFYIDEVRKTAKEAYVIIPEIAPAYGALYYAMDEINKKS